MAAVIYVISTATNLLCAILLLAAYGRTRTRLLRWSGLYFAGLTIASALVFIDLILLPAVDLFPLRLGMRLVALALLVFGLIWGER